MPVGTTTWFRYAGDGKAWVAMVDDRQLDEVNTSVADARLCDRAEARISSAFQLRHVCPGWSCNYLDRAQRYGILALPAQFEYV